MHWWKWIAFFPELNNTTLLGPGASKPKILLHFFPVANGISAPYGIQAHIEVFSNGKILSKQGFEGLRLNQPDGLELGDIFPEFFATHQEEDNQIDGNDLENTGLENTALVNIEEPQSELGLNIMLGTNQPRVDLSLSRVMVEFAYPTHRVRYHAISEKSAESVADRSDTNLTVFSDETFQTKVLQIDSKPADEAKERGHFLKSYELPKGPLSSSDSTQSVFPVQYLVQYETTSTLPISVRAL